VLYEFSDLMPVDVVRGGLSERLWNPEALELRHPPFVDHVLFTLGDAHRRPAPLRNRPASLQASLWSE
jgi:hypothetical protein